MRHSEQIFDAAVAWAVRTSDPAFDDWDAFTLWLEEDAEHARAYDRVMAETDDAAAVISAVPEIANDLAAVEPRAHRRGVWRLGGIAGLVAGVAAITAVWLVRDEHRIIATAPGETRIVRLESGGSVELSGATRMVLDGGAPSATVQDGEALFALHGKADEPFRVHAGGYSFVDIGTVFDVSQHGGLTSVAVAEGAVMYDPDGTRAIIKPGERMTITGGSYTIAPVAVVTVGEWRAGRLTLDGEPLRAVAQELSRLTGISFRAADAVALRPVSGSLMLDRVRSDPRSLGPLLDVEVTPAGQGWLIDRSP